MYDQLAPTADNTDDDDDDDYDAADTFEFLYEFVIVNPLYLGDLPLTLELGVEKRLLVALGDVSLELRTRLHVFQIILTNQIQQKISIDGENTKANIRQKKSREKIKNNVRK